MRTKDGRELSNALNVIFIELPKVKDLEENIEKNTALEKWAIFLKEADNEKKKSIIRKLTEKEAGLMQAQNALSSISENKELWIEQFRQEMFERDYNSGLSAARRQGLAEGMSKGLAFTAVNMLKKGMSLTDISELTGLSESEIKKLKQ